MLTRQGFPHVKHIVALGSERLCDRSVGGRDVRRVRGIGDKTALPLVLQFGSIEKVLENVQDVAETRARNCLLKDDAEKAALLSKDLVMLRRDLR